MLYEGSPASGFAQAGNEERGQNVNYCPPLLRPSPPVSTLALRSRTGRLLSLWLFVLRKIQRCRGAGACL